MNNEFSIQLTGSTDLNFLIYIQNDYLNQKQKADLPKFPLLSDSVSYTETFEADFKETWEQLTNREHNLAQKEDITAEDLPLTELELRWFYDRLIDSSVPYEEFQFFYRAFSAWWDCLAGRFSIERGLGEELHTIYGQLTDLLKERNLTPSKDLQLRFVYDDMLLAKNKTTDYFAVLSIEEFFIEREKLLARLLEAMK